MEIKNRPSFARTIKYRGTTLLSYRPLGRDLNRLKSLGDITVAPVVPTVSSAHRSQEWTSLGYYCCLAPTGNSLELFAQLLFLLKRI